MTSKERAEQAARDICKAHEADFRSAALKLVEIIQGAIEAAVKEEREAAAKVIKDMTQYSFSGDSEIEKLGELMIRVIKKDHP